MRNKNGFWGMPLVVILFGIIIDFFVVKTKNPLLIVNENYIYYVFASICTIAVLSYSIMTLLTGMLDKRYYGFRMKDILVHLPVKVSIKSYILGSLIYIGVGAVALALDHQYNSLNTMTMLLFSLLIIEGKMSVCIFRIISEDDFIYGIVSEYVNKIDKEKDNEAYQHALNCLYIGIDDAIQNDDYPLLESVFNILGGLIDSSSGLTIDELKEFNSRATDISRRWGYGVYVKNITKITSDKVGEDLISLLDIPIREMRYFDDRQMINTNYIPLIAEINLSEEYSKGNINDKTITNLLIQLFDSIINNTTINPTTRRSKIESFFDKVCVWSWWSSDDELKPNEKALLYIFKKYIFSANIQCDRKELMECFLIGMMGKKIYAKNDYYLFLSQICEAFYFYVNRETEVLTKQACQEIQELFQLKPKTRYNDDVCMVRFISESIRNIMLALGNKIANRQDSDYQMFEYYPPYPKVKTVVWTEEADVEFTFILFLLFREEFLFENFWDVCFGDIKLDDRKKNICIRALKIFFDPNTRSFSSSARNEIKIAELFFEKKCYVSEKDQELLFDKYNNITKELNDFNTNIYIEKADVNDVQSRFDELLLRKNIYGVDQWAIIDNSIKYSVKPYLCRKTTNPSSINMLFYLSIDAMYDCIRKNSDEIQISFDHAGIERMYAYLSKNNILNARNYTYTDDWAMQQYSGEDIFKSLKQKIESLDNIRTNNMNMHLYFNKEKYKMRIQLTNLEQEELTSEDCEHYIEEFRTQNGMYNIQEALYTKEEAIRFLRKGYYKESIELEVFYAFGKNDVTRITFEHKSSS